MTSRLYIAGPSIALDSKYGSVRAFPLRGDKQLAFRRRGSGNAKLLLEDGMSPFASPSLMDDQTFDQRSHRRSVLLAKSRNDDRDDAPPTPAPGDTAQTSFGLPAAVPTSETTAERQIEEELDELRKLFGPAE